MSGWKPIRSFDVDDGELDGLTPAQCFTLGYELALFDQRLESGAEFDMLAHVENLPRMTAECRRKRRECRRVFLADDRAESWAQIYVRAAP